MKTKQFNKLSREFVDECLKILIEKGKKYNTNADDDRLDFFMVAGKTNDESPERALWGMALKHEISIKQLFGDIDRGLPIDKEFFDEKIGDYINYMIILRMLLIKRFEEQESSKKKIQYLSSD